MEFRLGEIERLPLESASVDVIISNCVINLTADKLVSFPEIHRVLKPGGRILISDLVTAGELPEDVRASAAAWADCLAGAMEKGAYLETIRRAGFAEVTVVSESPMRPRRWMRVCAAKFSASKCGPLSGSEINETGEIESLINDIISASRGWYKPEASHEWAAPTPCAPNCSSSRVY